jgi:hypothetical protein
MGAYCLQSLMRQALSHHCSTEGAFFSGGSQSLIRNAMIPDMHRHFAPAFEG